MLKWIWSDDPGVWISQLGGICAILTAIFTGIYVLLTYHLMRASMRTAKIALAETQRSRVERLLPIKRTLDELAAAMTKLLTGGPDGIAAMAGGLAKGREDVGAQFGSAAHISEDLIASLRACHTAVDATVQLINRWLGRGATSIDFQTIQTSAESSLSAIHAAITIADKELSRSRRIVENVHDSFF